MMIMVMDFKSVCSLQKEKNFNFFVIWRAIFSKTFKENVSLVAENVCGSCCTSAALDFQTQDFRFKESSMTFTVLLAELLETKIRLQNHNF